MQISLTTRDDHTLDAYIAGPEDARHSIVVVQEIFGVNSHMRHVVDTFAALGYRVICPALFDRIERKVELGYESEDMQRGLELRSKIPQAQTLLDIEAAAAALQANGKIGIVGYCWGGSLAWLAACRSDQFSAASCWYGAAIAKTKDETARIPVQMHFGVKDSSIPMEDVEAIRTAQPDAEIYTYEGAGHGFGCEQRESYHADSAHLAQERTLTFFERHLA
jgi:carboxymethylenebutenolidase